MHGVFAAFFNGMQYRGQGGVVYVKGEECAYCFPNELRSEELRAGVAELVEASKRNEAGLYYVLREDTEGGKVDIVAYTQGRMEEELQKELEARRATVPKSE